MELKKYFHWSVEKQDDYRQTNSVYNGAGVISTNSWYFWPDLQIATKKEVEWAIKLWTEHGYEIPNEWREYLEQEKVKNG
jgi:hypothetical protein